MAWRFISNKVETVAALHDAIIAMRQAQQACANNAPYEYWEKLAKIETQIEAAALELMKNE